MVDILMCPKALHAEVILPHRRYWDGKPVVSHGYRSIGDQDSQQWGVVSRSTTWHRHELEGASPCFRRVITCLFFWLS